MNAVSIPETSNIFQAKPRHNTEDSELDQLVSSCIQPVRCLHKLATLRFILKTKYDRIAAVSFSALNFSVIEFPTAKIIVPVGDGKAGI